MYIEWAPRTAGSSPRRAGTARAPARRPAPRRAAPGRLPGEPGIQGPAVRFREEHPEDLARARSAVAAWREEHPAGTADQLTAALGGQFHPHHGPCSARCCSRPTGGGLTRSPGRCGERLCRASAPGPADGAGRAGPGAPGEVPGRAPGRGHRGRRVRELAGPHPRGERRDRPVVAAGLVWPGDHGRVEAELPENASPRFVHHRGWRDVH